ncbi:hypothetical protein D9758_018735 [Tetrapyrgos nigripes]|uniref:Uncharacterized protein n=1 Tax=Tetrapyrgos nigripes TaxID=182062 RepID=A0A8H5FES3_9AGAR|nr:hypothetical protein D9758_018735 [Tetrapyrgos nigripes]
MLYQRDPLAFVNANTDPRTLISLHPSSQPLPYHSPPPHYLLPLPALKRIVLGNAKLQIGKQLRRELRIFHISTKHSKTKVNGAVLRSISARAEHIYMHGVGLRLLRLYESTSPLRGHTPINMVRGIAQSVSEGSDFM